jgi:hypothetical protein
MSQPAGTRLCRASHAHYVTYDVTHIHRRHNTFVSELLLKGRKLIIYMQIEPELHARLFI